MNVNTEEPQSTQAQIDATAVAEIKRLSLPIGFFNAAAWRHGSGKNAKTLLLGRHVKKRGQPGSPDVGPMVLAVLRGTKVVSLKEIWKPSVSGKGDLLEDARAYKIGDNILLGFTRLSPSDKGYDPYPAYAVTNSEDLMAGKFPDTYHIKDMSQPDIEAYFPAGKNATPIGRGYFMFRPEDADHKFLACLLDNGAAINKHTVELDPEGIPFWATRRLGTTVPPLWLNDHEAVLVMHGIRMVENKYVYSVGSARLFLDVRGKITIDNVSKLPHLTPDSFRDIFPNEQVELRPEERRAIYICGGVAKYDINGEPQFLRVFPNIGDTRTVSATFSIKGIISNWDRTPPKTQII